MANYTLDSAKAKMAQQRIDESARRINMLLDQYTQAKQKLLSTWEGSMKDIFVEETGQHFENNCTVLIHNLKQVASDVGVEKENIITRHIRGSEIINS